MHINLANPTNKTHCCSKRTVLPAPRTPRSPAWASVCPPRTPGGRTVARAGSGVAVASAVPAAPVLPQLLRGGYCSSGQGRLPDTSRTAVPRSFGCRTASEGHSKRPELLEEGKNLKREVTLRENVFWVPGGLGGCCSPSLRRLCARRRRPLG